jgi:hypothetical protein
MISKARFSALFPIRISQRFSAGVVAASPYPWSAFERASRWGFSR